MAKKLKISDLKSSKSFRISKGNFKYLILYDYASGRKNRYNLIRLSSSNAKYLGKELTLGHCIKIINTK